MDEALTGFKNGKPDRIPFRDASLSRVLVEAECRLIGHSDDRDRSCSGSGGGCRHIRADVNDVRFGKWLPLLPASCRLPLGSPLGHSFRPVFGSNRRNISRCHDLSRDRRLLSDEQQ